MLSHVEVRASPGGGAPRSSGEIPVPVDELLVGGKAGAKYSRLENEDRAPRHSG